MYSPLCSSGSNTRAIHMPRRKGRKRFPRRVLQGRGGFVDTVTSGYRKFANWSKGPGRPIMNAGRALADAFFPGSGGWLKEMSTLLGLGQYKVRSNTLLASPVPAMHSTLDEGLRICHHEYLGEVNSSIAYDLQNFDINPGMSRTFPWLSGLAHSFQKYRLNGLIFFFKSTASNVAVASANNALGTVLGAVNYNVYADDPGDKISFLALSGAVAGKTTEHQVFPVECEPDMTVYTTRYVRHGAVDDDLAKYDAGKFLLAELGSQNANTIGELYVAYDITLMAPKIGDPETSARYLATGVDNTHPLGTAVTRTFDNVGLTIDPVAKTMTFQPAMYGRFLITRYLVVPSGANTCGSFSSGPGISGVLVWGGSGASAAPAAGETSTRCIYRNMIDVANNNEEATITFGNDTFAGGAATYCSIEVERMDEAFV